MSSNKNTKYLCVYPQGYLEGAQAALEIVLEEYMNQIIIYWLQNK